MSTSQLNAPSVAGHEWGRIARPLGLAWAVVFSCGAHAFEWCSEPELNIFGLSAHFYETKYSAKHGWNELNIGVGLTCHLDGVGRWNDEAELGVFRNSYRRTSYYAGYGIYYPLTPVISAGVRAVVASGYPQGSSSGLRLGIMPSVKVRLSESVTLNLSGRPVVKPFLCVHLGVKF